MTNGVFYISGDDEYLDEARRSAHSVAESNPQLEIAIATNADSPGEVFDRVISISPDMAFSDKPKHLTKSPFDRTLYLDTDTYVVGGLDGVFDVLDRVQVAAAQAPIRGGGPSLTDHIPDSFPQFNTGVLAYRSSNEANALFSAWEQYFSDTDVEQGGMVPDQPAFQAAVYESSITYHTLPPELNCRSIYPGALGGELKILHGRHSSGKTERIAGRLDESEARRLHMQLGGEVRVFDSDDLPKLRQILESKIHQTML